MIERLSQVKQLARRFWTLVRHPGVPIWYKLLPVAAVLYVLWPIDIISDLFPFLGQLDDVAIVMALFAGFLRIAERKTEVQQKLPTSQTKVSWSETVQFYTEDNKRIVAEYYKGTSQKGVILLHMMPEVRQSWDILAKKLQKEGWHVLAPDLRGHGESEGGPNAYKTMSDQEHQNSMLDIEAASKFLRRRGVCVSALIGASIGANLALKYAGVQEEIQHIVALSPGKNYRGVQAEAEILGIKNQQYLYLVGSKDDIRSSGETNADVVEHIVKSAKRAQHQIHVQIYEMGGHGTDMLKSEELGLSEDIVRWLSV